MCRLQFRQIIATLLCLFPLAMMCQAQRFVLFAPEVKTECPSAVYDFLERYLYEIDSLQRRGEPVNQKLRDDKVLFLAGSASSARKITKETPFSVRTTEDKYYETIWTDTLGNIVLDLAFPMQFELLFGKPKAEIELDFKTLLLEKYPYTVQRLSNDEIKLQSDSVLMSDPVSNYYVESLNTATYYSISKFGDTVPIYSESDKWHSAANLFQGFVDSIADYNLYVEQNTYGFNKLRYMVPLRNWLGYCQAMKLKTFFAVEEEREDGLKCLLIAQSQDLGFNHMMSVIIPDDFITNRKAVIKAVLNAYIPTQNVKNLYQQYVDKPKKKI